MSYQTGHQRIIVSSEFVEGRPRNLELDADGEASDHDHDHSR